MHKRESFSAGASGFGLCSVQCDQQFLDEFRDTGGDRRRIAIEIIQNERGGGDGKAIRKYREAAKEPLLRVRPSSVARRV